MNIFSEYRWRRPSPPKNWIPSPPVITLFLPLEHDLNIRHSAAARTGRVTHAFPQSRLTVPHIREWKVTLAF
ncbi:hypothetical protein PBRA_009726 [Plasmodiophora brassicae]|uniref:Uncharacterized protein n=1 Tax=Plasmodiophora brassicae TaxID=37360 RepID=A0A0G4IM78_PLABS|nr:hypothetical protein PBRA_009726 [Plasmodiophora brassicae]